MMKYGILGAVILTIYNIYVNGVLFNVDNISVETWIVVSITISILLYFVLKKLGTDTFTEFILSK